jgi:hypothetical protein
MGIAGVVAALTLVGFRARPVVTAVAAKEAALTNSRREMDPSLFMPEIIEVRM